MNGANHAKPMGTAESGCVEAIYMCSSDSLRRRHGVQGMSSPEGRCCSVTRTMWQQGVPSPSY